MITEVQPTASEQFIDDFIIVVENDFEAWSRITEMAETTHLFQFAQDLSDNYDLLVDTALKQVTDKFAIDLFRQLLNGWGMDTWYKIAKMIQERVEEDGN
jgi:hypothetical protein